VAAGPRGRGAGGRGGASTDVEESDRQQAAAAGPLVVSANPQASPERAASASSLPHPVDFHYSQPQVGRSPGPHAHGRGGG